MHQPRTHLYMYVKSLLKSTLSLATQNYLIMLTVFDKNIPIMKITWWMCNCMKPKRDCSNIFQSNFCNTWCKGPILQVQNLPQTLKCRLNFSFEFPASKLESSLLHIWSRKAFFTSKCSKKSPDSESLIGFLNLIDHLVVIDFRNSKKV